MRYWIPAGPLRFSFFEALFGYTEPPYPDIVAVCKECYRAMHRADGITLGYRIRAGKTQAYVKDVHY